MTNTTISILCASPRSVYRDIAGIDVFDKRRDARTFDQSTPIVAHPPCRAWSRWCAHQAKPEVAEKELGLWCCDVLRSCGGVLEQPAESRLFDAGGLPGPGDSPIDGVWSMEVMQGWWGFPTPKRTWLAFCGIDRDLVHISQRTLPNVRKGAWSNLSKAQRSATPKRFALWLIDIAAQAMVDKSGPGDFASFPDSQCMARGSR